MNNLAQVMKVLKSIMFEVRMVDTVSFINTNVVKRLPFDRQWSVITFPDGLNAPFEVPYMGGEKYALVPNSDVLNPLALVLAKHFKHLQVEVINIDNEYFRVNFYNVEPTKVVNEFFSPVISFVNSYNGKVKATASAGMYRVLPNGEKMFLNNGSIHYTFKHHSDEGTFALAKISEQVEAMMAQFSSIEQQVAKLKATELPAGKQVGDFMTELMPNVKEFPKKAIAHAVSHIEMEQVLFDTKPNLWLVYTALATAIKKHEGDMEHYQREKQDAKAWANILNFANIQ